MIDRFTTRANFTASLGLFLAGTIGAALAPIFPGLLGAAALGSFFVPPVPATAGH